MIMIKKLLKGNQAIRTRVLACILAVAMLLPVIPALGLSASAADATEEPSDTGYTACQINTYGGNPLVIYNFTAYTDSNGNIATGSGAGFALSGTNQNAGFFISVGDQPIEGDSHTNISNTDINLQLSGAVTTQALTVKKVNNGKQTVRMYVSGEAASSVGTLTVEPNATLSLTVYGELTLTGLVLGDGAVVTVSVQDGGKLTVGALSGTGTLEAASGIGELCITNGSIGTLNATGAKLKVGESLHADTLSLSNTTLTSVNAEAKATVTSANSITVSDSTVQNLALFGYAATAEGIKTVTLSSTVNGTKIENVELFGVAESANAKVRIEGYSALTSVAGSRFVSDFDLLYYHNGQKLETYETVAYRAAYSGFDATVESILGTLSSSLEMKSGRTALPEFVEDGYTFQGWRIDNSAEFHFDLVKDGTPVIAKAKDLTLATEVIAGEVLVIFDHGFDLSQYTHVCPNGYERTWSVEGEEIKVGADISLELEHPISRLGYSFTGWQITTGTAGTRLSDTDKSYSIAFADISEEGGVKTVRLVAQWEVASYPLRFSIVTPLVKQENIKVNLTGAEEGWMTLAEVAAHPTYSGYWNASQKYFTFGENIRYGQSIASYFEELELAVPMLSDGTESYQFYSWATANGTVVGSSSVFEYRAPTEGGMLDSIGKDMSLSEYHTYLNATPMSLVPTFGDQIYRVGIAKIAGWDVLIDGQVQSTDTDTYVLELTAGTVVTLRTTPAMASDASRWSVSYATDGGNGQRLYFNERAHTAGDPYMFYAFEMPEHDVEVLYYDAGNTSPYYFDLSKAPITMAENVAYNNYQRNGFWYPYKDANLPYSPLFAKVGEGYVAMSELTGNETNVSYFYTWNTGKLYITTGGVATQNQLTLINEITVYLKNCNLVATQAYSTDLVGRKIKNYAIEARGASTLYNWLNDNKIDLASYGNIIIDNSEIHSYKITFCVEGENTVNGIFPKSYKPDNDYNVHLLIQGESGKAGDILHLGTILGNFRVDLSNLDLYEIASATSEYLIYTNGTNEGQAPCNVTGCNVNITEANSASKRIHLMRGSLNTYGTTKLNIGSVRTYGGMYMYNSSHVHATGDIMGQYATISMTGTSTCIIDGNLDVTYDHWNVSLTLAGKYLIVKGTICSISGSKIYGNMIIIANNILLTNQVDVYGNAKIIANQILNRPIQHPTIDSNGYYSWSASLSSGYLERAASNGDGEAFLTYSQNSATTRRYRFYDNSQIYLLGYYQTVTDSAGVKFYNTEITAVHPDNPIAALIKKAEQDGIDSLTQEILKKAVDDEAAKYTPESAPECIIIGNSLYDVENPANGGKLRDISIYGSTLIYAAGNLTFFNSTTISGTPTIKAYGNLSCKRSLDISGGTITANAVGNRNRWSITTKDDDGVDRFSTTTISGGTLNVALLGNANAEDKTTLIIKNSPSIVSGAKIYQDILVSYFYDSSFTVADNKKQESIRISGTWLNGAYADMSLDEEKAFPAFSSGGTWALNSLMGNQVQKINSNGLLDDAASTVVYSQTKLALYAVRINYSLVVKELKIENSISINAQFLTLNGSPQMLIRGQSVELQLSSADYASKLILCYYDANGILHNVMPQINGTAVSFIMPAATVELYFTDEFSLDLSKSPVTLTSTGFTVTNVGDTRADGAFDYLGDIRIYQEGTVADPESSANRTYNKIWVIGSVEGRLVILNRINQNAGSGGGIEISENISVTFTIDDFAITAPIHLPKSANLTVIGLTQEARLFIQTATVGSVYFKIGNFENSSAGVGNVTFQDLIIGVTKRNNNQQGYLVYATGTVHGEKVVFNHVRFTEDWKLQSAHSLTTSIDRVEFINGCYAMFEVPTSYTSAMFSNVKELFIQDSQITIRMIGAQYGAYGICTSPSSTVPTKVTLDNSSLTYITRCSSDTTVYYENQRIQTEIALTMRNNSQFSVDRRLRLHSLVLEGGKLTVGTDTVDGYLLCNSITVSGGELDADYIIVSAYAVYLGTNETEARLFGYDEFLNWAADANAANRKNTGIFTLTDGIVTAKKFIGGASGATININGGSMNALAIGSYSAIFGYGAVIPKADEAPVYQYPISPSLCSSTVSILGGTVNILAGGYLGGHNSTVVISGGTVGLESGAVLGLTDAQRTAAEQDATSQGATPAEKIHVAVTVTNGAEIAGENGLILTPYGTLTVSGAATAVKADTVRAELGTVTVTEATGSYSLKDATPSYQGKSAGVYVKTLLSAQQLNVQGGALVYALRAEVIIPQNAASTLHVAEGAELYTYEYGALGLGAKDGSIDAYEKTADGHSKNIFCYQVVVSVNYELNLPSNDPDWTDSVTSEDHYIQGEGNFTLKPLEHQCYDFGGWYNNPDFEGAPIEYLIQSYAVPVILYAKWTPKRVEFQIIVDRTESFGTVPSAEDFAKSLEGIDGVDGRLDGDIFTYNIRYSVGYGSHLRDADNIHITDFNLVDYSFSYLEWIDTNGAVRRVIATDTVLTKDFLDVYKTEQPLTLRLSQATLKMKPVTFHLGGNGQNGAPQTPSYAEIPNGYTPPEYVDFNTTLNGAGVLEDENGQSILPTAPGYTFLGWAKDPNAATGDTENLFGETITTDTNTVYYGIWKANTYRIDFVIEQDENLQNPQITQTDELPTTFEGDDEIQVNVTYDQVINGSIVWGEDTLTGIPYAWRSGYIFRHWVVTWTDENGAEVTKILDSGSTSVLNVDDFAVLWTTLAPQKAKAASPVLTFTAQFEEVRVTYVDGTTQTTEAPAFGTPLKGYQTVEGDISDYDLYCKTEGNAVFSTKAAVYQANGFSPLDYRKTLQKNGYSFYGWFTTSADAAAAAETDGSGTYTQNALTTLPAYTSQHIVVYAAWHANGYTLVLNPTSGDGSHYTGDTDTRFANPVKGADGEIDSNYYTDVLGTRKENVSLPMVQVTVNAALETDNGNHVDVTAWPERAENSVNWYTYAKGVDTNEISNRRFLLGYTFVPLDPSTRSHSGCTDTACTKGPDRGACKKSRDSYLQYAANVTKLLNDKTLFQKHTSTFFIPNEYIMTPVGSDAQTSSIPDYPDGCEIQMYAVYRERSLVFIESYVNADGDRMEKELEAHPYTEYVNIRGSYTAPDEITQIGYSFVDWYLHGSTIDASNLYPTTEAQYQNALSTILDVAATKGSYDIKVYTVYAAQITVGQKNDHASLSAVGTPEADRTEPSGKYVYTLPVSMQSGQMKYSISETELKFVDLTTLQQHRFDASWGEGHTSDNTVAVKLLLFRPGETTACRELWLTDTEGFLGEDYSVSGGWRIELHLYHSEVMTKEAKEKTFTILFSFSSNNFGSSETDTLKDQWIKFEDAKIILTPSLYRVTYVASLPENDPSKLTFTAENGFNAENGYQVTQMLSFGSPLHAAPQIEGYTFGGWTSKYVDNGTLTGLTAADVNGITLTTQWEIAFFTLTAAPEVEAAWTLDYTPAPELVAANISNYGEIGTIEKDRIPYHTTVTFVGKTPDSYPEFVRVDGVRLDDAKYPNQSVTVTADVNVTYKDEETLYLRDGTIEIDRTSYRQDGAAVTWRGKYIILMDAGNTAAQTATNTLILGDDLGDRSIRLGNLHVTADNSIALEEGATAALTMYEESTNLILNNILVPSSATLTVVGGSFSLNPSAGFAGIGGNSAKPANGSITLQNGTYNLTLPASGAASGIGAAAADAAGRQISVTDCTVKVKQTQAAGQTYTGAWIGGKNVETVTLTKVLLSQGDGSEDHPGSFALFGKNITLTQCTLTGINARIAATDQLTVQNSTIGMVTVYGRSEPPIGSQGARISVETSEITVTDEDGWVNSSQGKLYDGRLIIEDAVSKVLIEITGGAALRLIELGNGTLTVTENGYRQGGVEVTDSSECEYVLLGNKDCTATDISTSGDIKLHLDTQSADIEMDSIGFQGSLLLSGNVVGGPKSNVTLTLASLTGQGDLTLQNLNAVTATGKIGSLGAANGSADKSEVTVENSAVTAETIGALGAQNTTYTEVRLVGASTVTGALVQDHYRIEYRDIEPDALAALQLDTVFRTTQQGTDGAQIPVGVGNALALAQNRPADAKTWYYQLGGKFYSIGDTALDGYDGHGYLTAALKNTAQGKDNSDGTYTVYVYLDMKIEIVASVTDTRVFAPFTGAATSVELPANGVMTVLVEFRKVNLKTGHYVLDFAGQALPKGTKLTLVRLLNDGTTSEYYYYLASGTETKLDLCAFVRMGDGNGSKPSFFTSVGPAHVEKLLISFDFSQCAAITTDLTLTVTPQFEVGTRIDQDGSLTCTRKAGSNGAVAASESTVTVTLPTQSVFAGKSYALVAKSDAGVLPYFATVTLTPQGGAAITGTPFGGSLLFAGINEGPYTVTVEGIFGSFTVEWILVLQGSDASDSNVMGIELAKANKVPYTVSVALPSLDITLPDHERTYLPGDTVTITYQSENVDDTKGKAILQKQNGASFVQATELAVSVAGGTVTVALPETTAQGVYRICISLDEIIGDSDDVYYTFVVEAK